MHSRDHDRLWADGGTSLEPPPLEQSRAFSGTLQELNRAIRTLYSESDSLPRTRAIELTNDFLSHEYTGGGYVSGLVKAAQLIVHFEIQDDDITNRNVLHSPEDTLIAWCLELDDRATDNPLGDTEFAYCLNRSEWQEILIASVDIHGPSVPLSTDQITRLSGSDTDAVSIVQFASILQERGSDNQARQLLQDDLESRPSLQIPLDFLELAAELNLEDHFRQYLRGSLIRWHPDDGIDRLASLVEMAREESLYAEIIVSIERWLRDTDQSPDPDNTQLIAALIEALLKHKETGREDALELYRTHIYPSEELYGIGSSVFEAATESGQEAVADDIIAAFDPDSFVPGESDKETGIMAARVAEHEDRWYGAFEIWTSLLEETSDQSICQHVIDNRLQANTLDRIEEFIDQLEEEFGAKTQANRYRILVRNRRNNHRAVIDLVDSTEDVFATSSAEARELAMAYVDSLVDRNKWGELESFLEESELLPKKDHRFYTRLAKLVQFLDDEPSSIDGQSAIETTERLLTAPMKTTELTHLMDLGVVRKVAEKVRKNNPTLEDRLDVVEGLVEILVSLHAERLIDQLTAAGKDTEQFERNLSEADLRRGGRGLLTELKREANRI